MQQPMRLSICFATSLIILEFIAGSPDNGEIHKQAIKRQINLVRLWGPQFACIAQAKVSYLILKGVYFVQNAQFPHSHEEHRSTPPPDYRSAFHNQLLELRYGCR